MAYSQVDLIVLSFSTECKTSALAQQQFMMTNSLQVGTYQLPSALKVLFSTMFPYKIG